MSFSYGKKQNNLDMKYPFPICIGTQGDRQTERSRSLISLTK
jgi:hypothetical protein